jgi:fluoride ion exporter CrcB/FEX
MMMINQDAAREALGTVAAAERDLVALQIRSNAIGNFITGGYLGAVTTFSLTKTGVSTFESAPATVLI